MTRRTRVLVASMSICGGDELRCHTHTHMDVVCTSAPHGLLFRVLRAASCTATLLRERCLERQ